MSGAEDLPVQAVICEVFRSPRREGMYLYVDKSEGLDRVPEALLHTFGPPQSALVLRLDAHRRLARADAAAVLDALRETGYYLQLPPSSAAVRDAEGLRSGPTDDEEASFRC